MGCQIKGVEVKGSEEWFFNAKFGYMFLWTIAIFHYITNVL
jgi:hypothetical protein